VFFIYTLEIKVFMDKKLLQALDNIGSGLEMLVDALKSKEEGSSSTGAALKQGDFGKQLQEINAGIKLIKKDTEQILKNQQTIIALSKEKRKDVIEEAGGDKKKESQIKKGVTTIILIATAVLAIGLALKLVGPVDVLSAIGLGLAMVAIGFAFAKVAEATKEFGYKEILMASLSMIAMATAITISSWIMSLIKPISITQALTAVFIGGVFSVVAFGMKKMLDAFKGIPIGTLVKSAIFLPLILPAIALGIALASYAFSLVKPIGFVQAISSIFIGAIFAVVSYGMRNMLRSFKGMSTKELIEASIFLPLILPAIALGIAGASYALTLVQPVGLIQWFTSILIGALFVVLSFGMVNIVKAMSKVDWKDIPKIPVFFVTMATAIMLSSHVLQYTADIDWLMMLKIAALGIIIAGLTFVMVPAFKILGKMDATQLLKGGLAIVIVAAAVMVSSHILSVGNYDIYPSLGWILGVGASIAAFGIAAVLLGTQALNPFFYAGMGVTLLVAATVMAASHILAGGDYESHPSLGWVMGVGGALTLFGIAAILLGFQAINPLFYLGMDMTLQVAETIVETSKVLSKGKYDVTGFSDWTKSVALLYATFTPIMIVLGVIGLANAVVSFFGPDPWKMAQSMILDIASTIVSVSHVLSTGNWKQGPTEDWAKGVSIAIGAFSPVYRMLLMSEMLESLKDASPEDFARAITTVVDGIVTAAWAFSNANAAFENGPSYKWAKGVGQAIGAFAPVYQGLLLAGFTGKEDFGPEAMVKGVMTMTKGIIAAAYVFAENTAPFEEGNYPSPKWGKGVGDSLAAFAPVFDALQGRSWYESGTGVIDNMVYGIRRIGGSLVDVARSFAGYYFDWETGSWKKGDDVASMWGAYPTSEWAKGVSKSVNGFLNLFDDIYKKGYSVSSFKFLSEMVAEGASSMASTARVLWKNKKYFEVQLDPNFIPNISTNILSFVELGLQLDKKLVTMVKKTSESAGFLGVGGTTTTEMVKQEKDMGIVDRVAQAMSNTAYIIWKNKKYFSFKIESDFIKRLSSNILDYAKLAEDITKIKSIGGLSDSFGISNDPIIKISKSMIYMAEAYDKLASAVDKFGNSIEKINIEKLNSLKGLEKSQLGGKLESVSPSEDRGNWWDKVTNKTANWMMPQVSDSKTKPTGPDLSDNTKFGKDGKTIPQQLDMLIDLLSSIDGSTNTIDEYIQDATNGRVQNREL
jgi:ABC-type spermidine/putrescine transport system permease subunit II